MSSSHFARSGKNTPQSNLNKSQQATQASFTPSSQASTITAQQPVKTPYVYKPPTRIVRSNVNAVKQTLKIEEKIQVKKQQSSEPLISSINQQPAVQKPTSFVRKPATEIFKSTIAKPITPTTEATEKKQEIKLTAVKNLSTIKTNRYNQLSSTLDITSPKKQQSPKNQQTPKPYYGRTKLPVEQKNQTEKNLGAKNPLQFQTQDNSKSNSNLQIKKPNSFYSYPKKIIKKQSQKQATVAQSQKKEQNQTTLENQRPQTPKFSKQQNKQTQQHPQMFSSTYSYRKKDNDSQISGQSSQSVSTVKQSPYQGVIASQPQKVTQSQKISSPTMEPKVKSPIKAPMYSASRYSNKVDTPGNEDKNVEAQHQPVKPPVKRSFLIAHVMHRLFTQKIVSYFQQIQQHCKNLRQSKGNQKIHQYIEKSVNKFIKIYKQNVLTRQSFNLMKSIYTKLVKMDMSKLSDPKITNMLKTNRNQLFGKVLQNILHSNLMQLKISFIKLKQNLNRYKNLQNKRDIATKILCSKEYNKKKQYFSDLSNWLTVKYNVKIWKLKRCSQINFNYKKWLFKQSWTKIFLNKLKELLPEAKKLTPRVVKKPPVSKIQQPSTIKPDQSSANTQLKQKVSDLETKLSQAKQKASSIAKQSDLRKKVQDLKQEKNLITEEIVAKKQRNQQLKQKLQGLVSKVSQESLSSLSQNKHQNQEPTLSLLHQIYMKVYKQVQPQCTNEENLLSLYQIHRVEQNSRCRQTVAKWLAINQNMSLKHWINLYEGNYVEGNKEEIISQKRSIYKQINEENDIVKKFIRSYIKERYLWEEVKEYVAAVISQ